MKSRINLRAIEVEQNCFQVDGLLHCPRAWRRSDAVSFRVGDHRGTMETVRREDKALHYRAIEDSPGKFDVISR